MRRSLSLKRESLTDLTTDELSSVNGGQEQLLTHLTCNLTDECTHGPSFDAACPTLPVYNCLSINPGCSALCTTL